MSENYEQKYLKYKFKYLNLKKQKMNQNGGGDNKIELILVKTTWCGYCKRFLPVWNTLKEQYENKFNFTMYDGDTDKSKIKHLKVDGYPTILIKKNNTIRNYNGPREMEHMIDLLDTLE